jgi:hypothetical protein
MSLQVVISVGHLLPPPARLALMRLRSKGERFLPKSCSSYARLLKTRLSPSCLSEESIL